MENETKQHEKKESAKVDKQLVLRHLKADLTNAKNAKSAIATKIIEWRNIYEAKPYGNEVEGRSKIVTTEARNAIDWLIPNLLKPFMTSQVSVSPVSSDDVQQADLMTKLLNYQFERKFQKMQFLRRAMFTMAKEGTVIARTGWEHERRESKREEFENIDPSDLETMRTFITDNGMEIEKEELNEYGLIDLEVVKYDVVSNNPTATILKNEDVYVDPEATSLDDARYIVQAIDTNLSALNKQRKSKGGIYDDKAIDLMEANINNQEDQSSLGAVRNADLLKDYSAKRADTEDKWRKRITIYEYFGEYDIDDCGIVEPIVCTFADDVILRLAKNPFPDAKPPFVYCTFYDDPYAFWGHAMVSRVETFQKLKTAMTRTFIDMIATSSNGMKFTAKGSLDAHNMRKLKESKIGDVIEYNPTSGAIPQVSQPSQIPQSFVGFYEMLTGEMENSSGITRYNQGLDASSLNKTATGVTAIMGQAQMRMWEISMQFSENLMKPLMRKWVAYNKEYLDDKMVMRIDDSDLTLTRDDIDGNFDLDINVVMTGANEQKQQHIVQLLQVAAPMVQSGAMPPQIIQKLTAKLFEVMDFKDIAKEINAIANGQLGGAGSPAMAGGQGAVPMPNEAGGQQGLPINNGALPPQGQASPMG